MLKVRLVRVLFRCNGACSVFANLQKKIITDMQTQMLLLCAVVATLTKQELEKYGLTGWYPTVITDAGFNIAATFDRPNFTDWLHCYCHVLHNAVQYRWHMYRNNAHNLALHLKAHEAVDR